MDISLLKPPICNKIVANFIIHATNNLIGKFSESHKARDHYRNSKTVYHYTSVESLFKIISTDSLIASNTLYLNDTQEIKYSLNVFNISLGDFLKRKSVNKISKKIVSLIQPQLEALKISDHYVTCFSAEKDLLSQWNAYGDHGKGVVLGFDRDKLGRSFQHTPVGAWVEYDFYKNLKNIDSILTEYFKSYSELVKQVEFQNETQIIDLGVEIFLKEVVPTFLGHYKNSCFKQEKEYRLALKVEAQDEIEIDFMCKNSSYIIPVTKLISKERDFKNNEDDFLDYAEKPINAYTKLPLKELILGPCVNREFAEPGIKMFLKKYGYEEVKISQSLIPLRSIN